MSKIDNIGTQYSILLAQQLDSQRIYYEGLLKEKESNFEKKLSEFKNNENFKNKIDLFIDRLKKKDEEIKKKDEEIKFLKCVIFFINIF
jgi:hypothetical protein